MTPFRTKYGVRGLSCLAVSPDGGRIAVGLESGEILVWDGISFKTICRLEAMTQPINSISLSPDGQVLISACWDEKVGKWDSGSGKLLQELVHRTPVGVVTCSSSRDIFAAGTSCGQVDIWSGYNERSTRLYTLSSHQSCILSLAFSNDGRTLVSGSEGECIIVWDTDSWTSRCVLGDDGDTARSLAVSGDGHIVTSVHHNSPLSIWRDATLQYRLNAHTKAITAVAMSPDGAFIASASWDTTIIIHEISSARQVHVLTGHTAQVLDIAFFMNGSCIVSCSADQTVRIWAMESIFELGIDGE